MKKEKAIKILENHIKKLNSTDEKRTQSFLDETKTYIDLFFGENSYQSSYFNQLFWSYEIGESRDNQEAKIINYIKDCIITIRNIGVYKQPVENWFSKLPDYVINLGLPTICCISFSFGVLFTNNNNLELKKEIKQLKEQLKKQTLKQIN